MNALKTTALLWAFLTLSSSCFGRHKSRVTTQHAFSLSIFTFSHATLIEGTMTYTIKNNRLKSIRHGMFSKQNTVLLSRKLTSDDIEQFRGIPISTLKDFYYNNCVMATSGEEYGVTVTNDSVTKTVRLHHYYEPQIEKLMQCLNHFLPEELKINYANSATKQDCKL